MSRTFFRSGRVRGTGLKPQCRQTMASADSISLAHSGDPGARSTSVTPYGLLSSSSFLSSSANGISTAGLSGFLAGGLPGGLAGGLAGLIALGGGLGLSSLATKVASQLLQRIFLPRISSGALLVLPHSGQVMLTFSAMT